MYALVLCCLIGQTYNNERVWLTNNLIQDHPAMAAGIRDKMSKLSDEQVHQLADYYREKVNEAQAQLQQLIEQRNALRQQVDDTVRAEEQRITAYGSALAQQQFDWTLNQFYNRGWGGWSGYGGWGGYRVPHYHYHPMPAPRYIAPHSHPTAVHRHR
jgi:hypothetical protein